MIAQFRTIHTLWKGYQVGQGTGLKIRQCGFDSHPFHFITLWSNGMTLPFGGSNLGSNPNGVTLKIYSDIIQWWNVPLIREMSLVRFQLSVQN